MSSRIDSSALAAVPETVSPELALVDPELGRRAREALPDDPWARWAVAPDAPPARAAARVSESKAETQEIAARAQRHAGRRLLPIVILAGMAVVLGAARPTLVEDDRSDEPGAAGQRPSLSSLDIRQPPIVRTRTGRAAPAAQPVAPRAKRRTLRPLARTQAKWTFVWPPHPRADYYDVSFLQGGREIFKASPRRARVVVPAQGVSRGRAFRFSGGRYRWIVRPGFGPRLQRRYGQPIVVSTWTLPRTAPE